MDGKVPQSYQILASVNSVRTRLQVNVQWLSPNVIPQFVNFCCAKGKFLNNMALLRCKGQKHWTRLQSGLFVQCHVVELARTARLGLPGTSPSEQFEAFLLFGLTTARDEAA